MGGWRGLVSWGKCDEIVLIENTSAEMCIV